MIKSEPKVNMCHVGQNKLIENTMGKEASLEAYVKFVLLSPTEMKKNTVMYMKYNNTSRTYDATLQHSLRIIIIFFIIRNQLSMSIHKEKVFQTLLLQGTSQCS